MRSPLSQAQLGVYYACKTAVSDECNFQNPVLFTLPSKVDIIQLRKAIHDALEAHSYLTSRIEEDENGVMSVRVDRTRKVPVTVLIRALGTRRTTLPHGDLQSGQPSDVSCQMLSIPRCPPCIVGRLYVGRYAQRD